MIRKDQIEDVVALVKTNAEQLISDAKDEASTTKMNNMWWRVQGIIDVMLYDEELQLLLDQLLRVQSELSRQLVLKLNG